MSLTCRLNIWRRDDRGQALVEFALIMPFLLLFLVGIVEFGRAWNQHQVITDAAREGARKAVVFDAAVTVDTVESTIKRALAAAGINPAGATITGQGTWLLESNKNATVSISLPYRFIFFGALKQWTTGESTVLLQTSVTMRNE